MKLASILLVALGILVILPSAQALDTESISLTLEYKTNGALFSGSKTFDFNLYYASSGGTSAYTDTQVISFDDGRASVALEGITGVDWTRDVYFAATPNGGSEMAPRLLLRMAPDAVNNPFEYNHSGGTANLKNLSVETTVGSLIATTVNASGNVYDNGVRVCTSTNGECGSGSGDISDVQGDGLYVYNGSTTGAVQLAFNETRLNATIDARKRTQEEIEDFVGGMVSGNTETRITVSYDDGNGKLGFVVEALLSQYTNDAGFLTSETGDIESVTATAPYITGGGTTGAVTMGFNETKLNETIDARDSDTTYTADGDYLYLSSFEFNFNETRLNATIDARDSDTTYTNGSGLSLVGTQFNHTDTSSQASVDNSGSTFVQDITLDTFGHITAVTSASEVGDIEAVTATAPYITGGGTSGSVSIDFNETKLNETIDARDSDTTYTADGEYLYLNSLEFNFNETRLNATIDDRATGISEADANNTYLNDDGDTGVGNYTFRSESVTIENSTSTASSRKAYRFRTSGGALDFEGTGEALHLSTWSGSNFNGTQNTYLVFDASQSLVTAREDWIFNALQTNESDFTVKGDNDADLLVVRSSLDRVGISTINPDYLLHVEGTAFATTLLSNNWSNATDLNVDGSLATDSVSTDEIATNGVGADEIAANAVGTSEIATNGVDSDEIAANAVGSSELASTTVTAGVYGNATVVPQITVDSDGRVTNLTNITITAGGSGTVTSVNITINGTTAVVPSGGPITTSGNINLQFQSATVLQDGLMTATQATSLAAKALAGDCAAGTVVQNATTAGVECIADQDTTYTNGSGLSLVGTQFNHTDTSSQASSDNSGSTFIQDVTLDTFGHITGLTTATEVGDVEGITAGEGIGGGGTSGTISINFDCSEVTDSANDGIGCSSEDLVITGDSYIIPGAGGLTLNESKLNATIDARASGMTSFNIDTDGEAATDITDGETIVFSDSTGMTVTRSTNTISFATTLGTAIEKGEIANSGTLSFDWANTEVADDLTISSSGSVDSTALTDGGTIGFDWVDAEVEDALTISSSGSVNLSALTNESASNGDVLTFNSSSGDWEPEAAAAGVADWEHVQRLTFSATTAETNFTTSTDYAHYKLWFNVEKGTSSGSGGLMMRFNGDATGYECTYVKFTTWLNSECSTYMIVSGDEQTGTDQITGYLEVPRVCDPPDASGDCFAVGMVYSEDQQYYLGGGHSGFDTNITTINFDDYASDSAFTGYIDIYGMRTG